MPLFQCKTVESVYSLTYSNMKTTAFALLSTITAASVVDAWGPGPRHHKGKYQPKSPHNWGPPGKPGKWPGQSGPKPPFQPGYPHGPWGQPEEPGKPSGPIVPALVTPVNACYPW